MKKLKLFLFGEIRKGDKIPENVSFRTTLPDERLIRAKWFNRFHVSEEAIQLGHTRFVLDHKSKIDKLR